MVSQPQPDPTAAAVAKGRIEVGLALLVVSVCPLCGEEHVLALPASETTPRVHGVLHWPIDCAGPMETPATVLAPPTHRYFVRVLASTLATAIERDAPRRAWFPFTQHDASR